MSFFKQNGMRRSLTWKDGMEKVGRDISSKKKGRQGERDNSEILTGTHDVDR
jgi:hypothetical protein